MRDAARGVSVSVTRSQLSRASSSAATSDGYFPDEHRQHFVERGARQLVVRIRAAHEIEQRRARPIVVDGDDGDDDLREHVERVLNDARRLDVAVAHRANDGEHLHRVVAKSRNEHAAADGVERMSGAADALQPVRHALRRLELEHEIDRPDVDSQLERARADERAQRARLERLLEHETPLARQRSVVRKRELLAGERVDPRRHLLGLRAIVDEDERRARGAHVLEARAA